MVLCISFGLILDFAYVAVYGIDFVVLFVLIQGWLCLFCFMLTLGLFSFAYFIYLFDELVVVFDGFVVVSGFGFAVWGGFTVWFVSGWLFTCCDCIVLTACGLLFMCCCSLCLYYLDVLRVVYLFGGLVLCVARLLRLDLTCFSLV